MFKKIRIFNYIMTMGFILWTTICISTNIDYLMSLVGLGMLLVYFCLIDFWPNPLTSIIGKNGFWHDAMSKC